MSPLLPSPSSVLDGLASHNAQRIDDLLTIAAELSPVAFGVHFTPAAVEVFRCIHGSDARGALTDPQVTAWLDAAAELVTADDADMSTSRGWDDHLPRLNLLAASLALIEKVTLSFRLPVSPGTDIRVPHTGLCIQPHTDVVNVAVTNGRLTCVGGTVAATQHHDGKEILLGDGSITIPDVKGYVQMRSADFGDNWRSTIAGALDLISTHERSYGLVSSFARALGPLKEGSLGKHLSISFRSLSSAVFLSWHSDPMVLGEAIVHEADHNMLYALSRRSDLWLDKSAFLDTHFWSPWRDDLRPLDGLLRGASAFAAVSEWLMDLVDTPSLPRDVTERAYSRAVETAHQVSSSLEELGRFGPRLLTRQGYDLLQDLGIRTSTVVKRLHDTSPSSFAALSQKHTQEIVDHRQWVFNSAPSRK